VLRVEAAGGGLQSLLEFLTRASLWAEVGDLTDRILTAEATSVVSVDEGTVALRGLEPAIADEADRARRARLERARVEAIEHLNPALHERFVRLHEAASRVGARNYAALWEARSGIALDDVEKLAHGLLEKTQEMYTEVLTWMLKRKLGVAATDAQGHDLARLFRAPEFDRVLPTSGVASVLERAIGTMRIDLWAGGRIRMDAEPRPTKQARAFVTSPEVPDRVIVVIRPQGGWTDYRALLHALGHALHRAHTDPSLPVERRRLGDASQTEAFAALLECLLLEPGFARRFLEIPLAERQNFLRLVALDNLARLRRCAAMLIYERHLHETSPSPRMAEVYGELIARAAAATFPASLYLYETDPWLDTVRAFRGRVFGAQLREALRERFDEEWYRNDRTGGFLLDLWHRGLEPTVERLGAELELGPPDIEPLIQGVGRHLG